MTNSPGVPRATVRGEDGKLEDPETGEIINGFPATRNGVVGVMQLNPADVNPTAFGHRPTEQHPH